MHSRRETISLSTGSHACICGESSPKSELDRYGLAVTLYFRFVKNLSQWFVLFSILSMIPLVFYVRGKRTDNDSSKDKTKEMREKFIQFEHLRVVENDQKL